MVRAGGEGRWWGQWWGQWRGISLFIKSGISLFINDNCRMARVSFIGPVVGDCVNKIFI